MSLLAVKAVSKRFGGLAALSEIDFTVDEGTIQGLIGPNGAGKTTMFNVITGIYGPSGGDVTFGDRSIVGIRPHRITALGIARTFQNIRLFANMTALENVIVGADVRNPTGVLGALFRPPSSRRNEQAAIDEAYRLLDFVGIKSLSGQLARNLSYGDQRRVEIARALATKPRLLLLDEPAAGMNPAEKVSLTRLISRVRDTGVTILLIEHDMKVVMGICDRVSVLDFGEKIAEGRPEELQRDPRVIEAYLGRPAAEGGE